MTEGVTCYQCDEVICANPECLAAGCLIEFAYTEARMVIERYEIGNPSEQATAFNWLLKAYEANQDKPK